MHTHPARVVVIADPQMIDNQIEMTTYIARQMVALGILQLLIGILCTIFQCVALGIVANQPWYLYGIDIYGHGIWNGTLVSTSLMSNMDKSEANVLCLLA